MSGVAGPTDPPPAATTHNGGTHSDGLSFNDDALPPPATATVSATAAATAGGTNLSGSVQGSCLLAILGPSGAGKTTLLDILSGRKLGARGVGGEVRVGGALVGADELRRVSG